MLLEYHLKDHEILAPRVDRMLDRASWKDVRDFTRDLHDMEDSFVPESSDLIDLSIFSSREFARSYRESPINSKVRVTKESDHLNWFTDDMHKIPEFNQTVIADIQGITTSRVGSKILFGMKLVSRALMKDRKGAVSSNKRLTHVNLGWELSDLIFGWVNVDSSHSSRTCKQLRDMGQLLLMDNDFNIQLQPGTVDNHIVELYD